MFNIDDIVTYGINGVCKIVDIEEKDIIGTKKFCLVLKPINNDRTTYYVPADNEKQLEKLHKILSEEEINKIIDSASKEEPLWIDNEKQRKEYYQKIISESNHSELIKIIRAIHSEKTERESKGKKLLMADERFLKDAEKILFEEFGYVLNLSESDVIAYIFSKIEKS